MVKRKYFFKLYVKLAISTCLFAFLIPLVLTRFMLVKLTNIHVRTLDKQLHELTINFHLAYATDSNYEKASENSRLATSSAQSRLADTRILKDTWATEETLTSGNYSICLS